MIGPKTTIRGNLSGDEDLTVEGRIEGTVRITRELIVAASATLVADVEAQAVTVSGRVTGNIQAAEAVSVDGGAVVVGNITTPRLSIAEGARFKGRVEMAFDIPGVEPRPQAPARRR